jgi:hypothetical protein
VVPLADVWRPAQANEAHDSPDEHESQRAERNGDDPASRHRRRSPLQPCGGLLQGRPGGEAVSVGCRLGSDELGDGFVEVEVARFAQELAVPIAEGGLQLGIEPAV